MNFKVIMFMGLLVVSFVLFGQSILYLIFEDNIALSGYGFGASLVALFCRVGGGIYTKAADVGADLVGKVCLFFILEMLVFGTCPTACFSFVASFRWKLEFLKMILEILL